MAEHESLTVGDYAVERFRVGRHTLGQIQVNDNITVVFQMRDDDPSQPSPEASCLACRISKISACAELVCPDIKAHDPDASCSDAILECVAAACRGSCGAAMGAGGMLVIA